MKIVDPEILEINFHVPNNESIAAFIERTARTCYKSEDKITPESASKFVRGLVKRGHHAMLEFVDASVRISADRGLTHELVRHRLASFAQESTRYCNYSKDGFGKEITVVKQPGLNEVQHQYWIESMIAMETVYMNLLEQGVSPQIARSVLPIATKSEIVIKANLREWRHIFKMRCDTPAHPIIRGIMLDVLRRFYDMVPAIYEDQAEEFLSTPDLNVALEENILPTLERCIDRSGGGEHIFGGSLSTPSLETCAICGLMRYVIKQKEVRVALEEEPEDPGIESSAARRPIEKIEITASWDVEGGDNAE